MSQTVTYARITGGLGITSACLGILSAVQLLAMPLVISMQQQAFDDFRGSVEQAPHHAGQVDDSPAVEMVDDIERMWRMPGWFGSYCVAMGGLGVALSAACFGAAVNLIRRRRRAVTLFMIAFSIVAITALSRFVILLTSGAGMAMVLSVFAGAGAVGNAFLVGLGAFCPRTAGNKA